MLRHALSSLLIGGMTLLYGAGCTRANAQPVAAPSLAAANAPSEVDVYRAWVQRLADPAMEGRGAGYAGLDRARDLLARELREIGLEPAFPPHYTSSMSVLGGGDEADPNYKQSFDIPLPPKVQTQQLTATIPTGPGGWHADPARRFTRGAPVDLQAGEAFNVLGLSGSGWFLGDAAFLGYGVQNEEAGYDSFAALGGESLRGRVAIMFRYEPMTDEHKSRWGERGRWTRRAFLASKAKLAAEHGAAALLVVTPPSHADEPLLDTASTAYGEVATIPVLHVTTASMAKILDAAGFEGEATLEQWQREADGKAAPVWELEGAQIGGRVDIEHPVAKVANVGGYVPGHGKLADQVVIVGAHYDHLGHGEIGSRSRNRVVHPGADDNASGTAGVLTLARRWQTFVRNDARGFAGPRPRRAVLFVLFTAEERGLLGSRYMTQHDDELPISLSLDRTVAMLNLDMIGRLRGDTLYVFGTGSGREWDALLEEANRPPGLEFSRIAAGVGASDHTMFYLRKIPVLHFFTGLHNDYHRPSDTADKVNVDGAVRVLDLVEALLHRVAIDKGTPVEFVDGE